MKLYLVRHGESEANRLRIISNRPTFDHALTETGRQQAADLAANLSGIPFWHLYGSPVKRARQTTEIVSQALGIPFTITDALREYDCGLIEGRGDDEAWEMWRALWHDWLDHQRHDRCIEGGETFHDIRARYVPFIEGLIAAHGQADHNFLLVGHGGTTRMMLPLILSNADQVFNRPFRMDYTSPVIVEYRDGGLVCVSWCGEVM